MNKESPKFLVGSIDNRNSFPVWISYLPCGIKSKHEVLLDVQIGEGREAEGATLPPWQMLEFRPGKTISKEVDGELKRVGWEVEPPHWFERQCQEAKCAWFIPVAQRMASGEQVPLEEVQAAYRLHNEGREMFCGEWGVLFSRSTHE